MNSALTAGEWGQATVLLILCIVTGSVIGLMASRPAERALRRFRYHLGFLRGYRAGNRDRATTVLLRRVGYADASAEPRDPVRFASTVAAWRAKRRGPITPRITPLRTRLDRLDARHDAQDDAQDEDEDAWGIGS